MTNALDLPGNVTEIVKAILARAVSHSMLDLVFHVIARNRLLTERAGQIAAVATPDAYRRETRQLTYTDKLASTTSELGLESMVWHAMHLLVLALPHIPYRAILPLAVTGVFNRALVELTVDGR